MEGRDWHLALEAEFVAGGSQLQSSSIASLVWKMGVIGMLLGEEIEDFWVHY